MNEYDVKTPYGNYQTKGEDDPYHILMKMASWNKELRTTISDVKYSLDGTIERQSQIIQNVDSITQNVTNITTDLEGTNTRVGHLEVTAENITLSVTDIDDRVEDTAIRVGQIEVRAGNIEIGVADFNSRLGIAESSISVQAGLISNKVSISDFNGNTIASQINQTATTILLEASKIKLNGITEVANSLYVGGRTGSMLREVRFGGQLGGARISADDPNILNLWAGGGHIAMNSPVSFTSEVAFNNVSVTGLNAPKMYLSHQIGSSIEVTSTGMIVRTPSGTTHTFKAV